MACAGKTASPSYAARKALPRACITPGRERGAPAEAHLADLPQHPLDYSQVRPAQSRGFGPLPSEANVNLLLLRRTMGPITQGLAELSRALKARDQLTVARPVATVGAADTHGGRNSN